MKEKPSGTSRGQFSNVGFILAAAGSAIGLGNLWKFPYLTGSNGGGIFVLVYLVILVTIGFACGLAEMALGKHTKLNPVGAFRTISKKWAIAGFLGILIPFFISTYYVVIGGWITDYLFHFIGSGASAMAPDTEAYFNALISDPIRPLLWTCVFVAINLVIVSVGIKNGIERANKVMMPALFVLLIVMAIRACTLPGAMDGIRFFLQPDFKSLSMDTVAAALVQVFFSLSLGTGCTLTYASYLPKETDLVRNALIVPALDSTVALLAGFVTLPAVFAFGFAPEAGPGLIFITLPAIFNAMPFGNILGFLFFLLIMFAALTSSVALLEPPIAWLIDTFRVPRKRATIGMCLASLLVAVPVSLSNGPNGWQIGGRSFFDFVIHITEDLMIPISALLLCLLVGYVWKRDSVRQEISQGGMYSFRVESVWYVLLRYVAPPAIFFVWLTSSGIL